MTSPPDPAKPLEVTAALLAERVELSQDGKLFILGVFDRIIASKLPATHPSLFLYVKFAARVTYGTDHKIQVACVDADGGVVIPRTDPLAIRFGIVGPGRPLVAQFIAEFAETVFPVFGDYDFYVYMDGEHILSVPLSVESKSAEES
ncbi:MAG TPA: hypothetical protein VHG08_01915 [Longimicrobium sp.]|nr:hypothetical protein [Longimicrobium sp.]